MWVNERLKLNDAIYRRQVQTARGRIEIVMRGINLFSGIYGHAEKYLKLQLTETENADFRNEFQVETRSILSKL